MAKTPQKKTKSVDEYLAAHALPARAILRRVRATIRAALPDADETISYGIPAYKSSAGAAIIFFAGWREHYAIYPATASVVAALARELSPYEVEKGTIRFPLVDDVPVRLIARIASLRAKETAARAKSKNATAKMKKTTKQKKRSR